nr:AraC family transcriptional regulator [uncultured Arsenicibacter sp.]
MAVTDLFIKNMVCSRCIRAVQIELERQGYQIRHIELGKATIEGESFDLIRIRQALIEQGFDLLTERNARLVSLVKTLIITLIQSGVSAQLKTSLSDYLAAETRMDYAYLSHVFSITENLTIEKFWIRQRVERAKELLSYQELSINEISKTLGYSSTAYLTNQFKQITGLTPAAYRKRRASDRNPLDWI